MNCSLSLEDIIVTAKLVTKKIRMSWSNYLGVVVSNVNSNFAMTLLDKAGNMTVSEP